MVMKISNVDAMLTDIEETYNNVSSTWTQRANQFRVTRFQLAFLVPAKISTTSSRASKAPLTPTLVLTLTLPFRNSCRRLAISTYLNMIVSKEYNKVDLRKQELLATPYSLVHFSPRVYLK